MLLQSAHFVIGQSEVGLVNWEVISVKYRVVLKINLHKEILVELTALFSLIIHKEWINLEVNGKIKIWMPLNILICTQPIKVMVMDHIWIIVMANIWILTFITHHSLSWGISKTIKVSYLQIIKVNLLKITHATMNKIIKIWTIHNQIIIYKSRFI